LSQPAATHSASPTIGSHAKIITGASVAPYALQLGQGLLRGDESADQVRGHAAKRIAERRHDERGPEQIAVQLQYAKSAASELRGTSVRRDEGRGEQGYEADLGGDGRFHSPA